jgi:polysaccharide deacetylase family protein (PEP-CTERM system associated)
MVSSLTIDVEDGINISMRDNFRIEMKPTCRVVDNVDIILEICERNNVKATFFILGEVAEIFPDLVKRIDSNGHEIGIHGYHHDQLFRLTPKMFRNELIRAKGIIESLAGQKIMGFRAPAFSIMQQTSWALPIIAESGFKYDSSIFPAEGGKYGWKGFNKHIIRLELPNGTPLIEVPLSVVNVLGRNIPTCGGGYFRYLPYFFTRQAFKAIQKERPVIVYLHPYELDTLKYPEYFYKARASVSLRKGLPLMLYRLGKNTVKGKLEALLKEFKFLKLIEIIENLDSNGKIPSIEMRR